MSFLTPDPLEEEALVVDPFGGSLTVPLAAELLGRLWVSCDLVWEYLRGAALRFCDHDLVINPNFDSAKAAVDTSSVSRCINAEQEAQWQAY